MSSLEGAVAHISAQQGVVGVVVSDAQGLCLASQGIAQPEAAGFARSLLNKANKFHGNGKAQPIVRIESDNSDVLIREGGSSTLAVYKSV